MPIESSQIVRNHNRGNGLLSVHEEHTDHNGKIHEHRYRAPLAYDTDQALIDWIPILDALLISSESDQVTQDALNGADPETMTFNHLLEAESVRARMKAFLTGQATEVIHMLEWVQSFTTPQLNGLGFTSQERGQINAREGTINGVKSLLETDALFILDDF